MPEITPEIVAATRKWLGPQGVQHFIDYNEKFGTVAPNYVSEGAEDTPVKGAKKAMRGIPHPTHFREGMMVRNFLRSLDDCKGWKEETHDFDNNWTKVIEEVIKEPFNHPEGFAHMTYRCEICGWEARIWNSRDGVTPFMGPSCRAPGCAGHTQHVDWDQDKYEPDYQLQPGDFYWDDFNEDDAKELAEEKIEHWWDNPDTPMSARFADKDEAREALVKAHIEDHVKAKAPTMREYKYSDLCMDKLTQFCHCCDNLKCGDNTSPEAERAKD